jgi:L-ascorbate metabolism protein UlaG (beta-lactamase superfamily)
MTTAALMLLGASLTAPSLNAQFIGNMSFHVSDGETSLLTDFPYQSGYSGYMTWRRETLPALHDPLCLITHSHRDHFARELVEETCARLLGAKDVVAGFEAKAVPVAARVDYRGLVVEPIATPHAKLEHYSYRVTWAGLRLYFTGDTESTDALLGAGPLDVAFVSPWLIERLKSRGAKLDARRIVVYHHRDGEAVPEYQGREVPRQGEVLVLRKPD